MPLPKPVGRQKEVLYLPAAGHVAVLGTAGSGKTTLAILRSAYLATPSTEHCGRTLLVTFNRALVTYLQHLRQNLGDVVVENYHAFARGYLASRGAMPNNCICDGDLRKSCITGAVADVSSRYEKHALFERPASFFFEEIRWIAQHGIATAVQYQEAERIGRGGQSLARNLRPLVYEIAEAYRRLRATAGRLYDWDDLASEVCRQFDGDSGVRRYRHVVIDEGQDFSPEMIRSLVKAVPSDGSLTFFGDVAQQIYGHRMSWRSAGLRISTPWQFKENYRNSKQIAKLGLAIAQMPYFREVADMVEPVSPTADGPLPTIVKVQSPEREIALVVEQAWQAAKTQTVGVLFRDREDEKKVSGRLPPGSIQLHRNMKTWSSGPGVKYGTYHSAKGLEFDTVILPFLTFDRLPDPAEVTSLGREDAKIGEGRLLYVGVTRAKSRLIMTYCGQLTDMLPVSPDLYEVVEQ